MSELEPQIPYLDNSEIKNLWAQMHLDLMIRFLEGGDFGTGWIHANEANRFGKGNEAGLIYAEYGQKNQLFEEAILGWRLATKSGDRRGYYRLFEFYAKHNNHEAATKALTDFHSFI